MPDEGITYDPEALPNSLEVTQLQETRALSQRMGDLENDIALLGAQSGEDASTGTLVLDDAQYDAIVYDLRVNNTISILLLVVLGICAGLSGWLVFSWRWK